MKDYKRENPAVGAYSNTPLNESFLYQTIIFATASFFVWLFCIKNGIKTYIFLLAPPDSECYTLCETDVKTTDKTVKR